MKRTSGNIGSVRLTGPFLAAPMAGITDAAFRRVLSEMGAALVTTEMVSGKGLLYDNKNTKSLLSGLPGEVPLACQIFGSEPEVMREAAGRLSDHHSVILDINGGCPVPKVVRNGEGSALLKDLDQLHDVVEAAVSGTDKPVTVKLRTGWDRDHIIAVEAARACEAAGAAAVTIHGRTREQFYTGRADREIIGQVKAALSIPVIGNGDVFTAKDALAMMDQTGCDMVMIGRGMLGDPWIFREAEHLLRTGEELPAPGIEDRKEMVRYHLSLAVEEKGEARAVPEFRKHLGWYFKGMPKAAAFRRRAHAVATVKDVNDLLEEV